MQIEQTLLTPGTKLSGRYRIDSTLGQGGMGAVYLAFLEPLDKPVAVKEMYISETGTAAIEQFTKEAKMLAHLDHPALVPVSDFFTENGRYYFVMAFVEGKTLADVITQKGHLSLQEAVDWTLQLCSVLEFLHQQNPPILFRDLKPSNVMIDSEGKARLIDFGIARVLENDEKTATFLQGVGSAGYSPLEQYGGDMTTDQRSDLYSLGATLYAMLTGKSPASPISRVSDRRPVDSPRKINPEVPINLEAVLVQMLAVRKEERQASVAVARAEIETATARFMDSSASPTVRPDLSSGDSLDAPTSRILAGLEDLDATTDLVGSQTRSGTMYQPTEVTGTNLSAPAASTRTMPQTRTMEEPATVNMSLSAVQGVLCAVLIFLTVPYFSEPHGRFGFFEYVAYPFHMAGHLFGQIFGSTGSAWGGPLGQMALPVGVLVFLLVKHRSVFGLSAATVWVSQTFVSWGAHMHKAKMGKPAFFGESDHDWQSILGKMHALHNCEKYGDMAIKVGQLGMLLGLAAMCLWLAYGYFSVPDEPQSSAN